MQAVNITKPGSGGDTAHKTSTTHNTQTCSAKSDTCYSKVQHGVRKSTIQKEHYCNASK